MVIGLFEIDHYEMGYAIVKTIDFEKNKIIIFTTEPMYRQFIQSLPESKTVKYIVQKQDETIEMFYSRSVKISIEELVDLFWINTIETKYSDFAKSLTKLFCYKVLTIHNVNQWFGFSKWFFSKSYRRNKSRINLLKQIDSYVVLSSNVKNYFLKKFKPAKKVFVFPYSIYANEFENKIKSNNTFTLAIPGSIELARRNYDIILNCYSDLFNQGIIINLFLLGAPKEDYGNYVIDRCKELNSRGAKITFFETSVGQQKFDDLMLSSDFVLSPLQPEIRGEKYGYSKETGCFFDMARYSKPGIVPDYVPIPDEQKGSIVSYQSQKNLCEILKNFCIDKALVEKLTEKAKLNSQKYSVEYLRNDPSGIIKTLMMNYE